MRRMMINSYRRPRTVEDVARAIEMFLMDAFAECCSGGCSREGGNLRVEFRDGPGVQIDVRDASDAVTLAHPPKPGLTAEWLEPDELALIETIRDLKLYPRAAIRALRSEYDRPVELCAARKAKAFGN